MLAQKRWLLSKIILEWLSSETSLHPCAWHWFYWWMDDAPRRNSCFELRRISWSPEMMLTPSLQNLVRGSEGVEFTDMENQDSLPSKGINWNTLCKSSVNIGWETYTLISVTDNQTNDRKVQKQSKCLVDKGCDYDIVFFKVEVIHHWILSGKEVLEQPNNSR